MCDNIIETKYIVAKMFQNYYVMLRCKNEMLLIYAF